MRNILEYPITAQECINHIKAYGDREIKSGVIGGTGPYVTQIVAEFLEGNQEFQWHVRNEMAKNGVVYPTEDDKKAFAGEYGLTEGHMKEDNEGVSPETMSGVLKTY